ncbi:MAG: DNA internalization-related competence protein ComEC/Rec2 [Pseudomonadota bacterium]
MHVWALLGGAWLIIGSTSLPSIAALAGACALLSIVSRRLRPLLILAGIGAVTMTVAAERALMQRWPLQDWYVDQTIDGVVHSFVAGDARRISFLFRGDIDGHGERLIRVQWYRAPPAVPRLGERWRLTLRLRAPRGVVNPGGFDVERHALSESVNATAYVVNRATNERLQPTPPPSVAAWRHRVAESISTHVSDPDHAGMLVALAVGSRHALTPAMRELTLATGTAHLLAVSGLHIGLAAVGGAAVGRLVTAPMLLLRGVTPRLIVALFALVSAGGYALAAGFAVPTRRALLMIAIGLAVWVLRRPLASPRSYSLALLAVFCLWPMSALGVSVYLSFGMVGLLLIVAWRSRVLANGKPRFAMLRIQALLSLAALPIGLGLFGAAPWFGIAANVLMIPLVSFIIVPALLLVVALPSLAAWVLPLLDRLLALALPVLDALAGVATLLPVSPPLLPLVLIAVLIWTPLAAQLRAALALLAAAGLIASESPPVRTDCAAIAVIDVGQGQAVLLRAGQSSTLIDTGASWATGSVAQTTIVPLLRRQRIARLDRLIVSHSDNDHAGGAHDIVRAFRPRQVISGEALPAGLPSTRCRRGQQWSDGGVTLSILGPESSRFSGNDASCVVQVQAGAFRVLIPGDIEARGEQRLLASGADVASDVVVMPHHGSASSSTPAFIAAVDARYAIASAGYRNRWQFPRSAIVRRWQEAGARVLSTGSRGLIGVTLCSDGVRISGGERMRRPRWWRHPGQ